MITGEVTRPDYDLGDKEVVLTATVTKGTVSKQIQFPMTIKRAGMTEIQAVMKDINSFVIPSSTKTDIILPIVSENGCAIVWESSDENIITRNGKVTRDEVGEQDKTCTLTVTVSKGKETQTKEFSVLVPSWTLEDEIEDAKQYITWELIAGDNSSIKQVYNSLSFPDTIGRDVEVSWSSTNTEICDSTGTITRPTYTQGVVIINITASLSKSTQFNPNSATGKVIIQGLYVQPKGATNDEMATDALGKLNESLFLGDNESLNKIVTSMYLPATLEGQLSSYISVKWKLINPDTNTETTSKFCTLLSNDVSVSCTINRPTASEGNAVLTLLATVISEDPSAGSKAEQTKKFTMIVLAMPE